MILLQIADENTWDESRISFENTRLFRKRVKKTHIFEDVSRIIYNWQVRYSNPKGMYPSYPSTCIDIHLVALRSLAPIDLIHDIVAYTGIPSSRFHFYVRGTQVRYLINDAPAWLEDDI